MWRTMRCDCDFGGEVMATAMTRSRRSIANDAVENGGTGIDDDESDGAERMWIDSGGDDDGEHSGYWNSMALGVDGDGHSVGRTWRVTHVDGSLAICVDGCHAWMEWTIHGWTFYRD